MFADIFEDIFQPMFSDMFGLSKVCQAIRFNGVNNYGQLATRAIDPDGDIDIEWYQAGLTLGQSRSIVNQTDTGTFGQSEFRLWWNSDARLIFQIGTGSISFPAANFKAEGRYRVFYSGQSLQLYIDNVLTQTLSYARGTTREPTAPTRVGARFTGSAFTDFFNGLIPYIRINNFYYAMDAVGQAIQPSLPAGNDMTLFNTVPEQWEEISCDLRPEA